MTNSTVFETLVQSPVYLSEDHVRQNVLPAILTTIALVSGVYCASFPLVAERLIPQNDAKAHRVFSYQTTNLVTNAVLGLMGVYFQYFVLPEHATTEERIYGLTDLYVLGAVQIGFQIWSIIVGILYVNESPEMLIHHVAVIFASSKTVFLTNGFRYYAPLALGMTELSSVPLSVMNSFKNNASWREAFPQAYLASRLIFALAFLVIRIGIFVPAHVEYLWHSFWVNYHAETQHVGAFYRGFMGTAWLGAVFLLALQLYWGYLIVKGLASFVLGQKQAQKKKKTI